MHREDRARPEDVFSKRASFYTSNKVHDDKETLSRLVGMVRPTPDMALLDVGTGAGHTALAVAPHVRQVEAIDVTERMLDEARKLAAQRGIVNVRFVLGDATSLPYPDGRFDAVTCRRAAHHFRDVRKALSEMARVLRKGGRMVIDDRSVPEDDEVDRTINRLDVLHDPSHIRDYRASEWRAFLAELGLEIERVETYRKRLPLSHFTSMVDEGTAREMTRVALSSSEDFKREVALETIDGELFMDNFFVLIAAVKS